MVREQKSLKLVLAAVTLVAAFLWLTQRGKEPSTMPTLAEVPVSNPLLGHLPIVSAPGEDIPKVISRVVSQAKDAFTAFRRKDFEESASTFMQAGLLTHADDDEHESSLVALRRVIYRNAAVAYRAAGLRDEGRRRLADVLAAHPDAHLHVNPALDLLVD